MNFINPFPRVPFLYAPDDAAGATDAGAGAGEQPAEKTESQEHTDQTKEPEKKFSQADLDRIVQERLERAHKKTEEATAKAKSEAEAAALKEQGKFKELAEQNQKAAEEEKAKREALEAKMRSIELRGAFEKSAKELGIEFENESAAEDAFEKLDTTVVGEDLKGMKDAVKKLLKERPHFFKKTEAENIDARTKSRESAKGVLTDARKSELKQRFRVG